MTGGEPNPLELKAAQIVAEHVDGMEWHRDRPGAPARTHDFDITLPDGRRIALEVTTIADTEVQAFYTVIGDHDWRAPELRADWWVGLAEPEVGGRVIRIKHQKPKIVRALATLEAHDTTGLDRDALDPCACPPESTPPAVCDAIATLTSAGVLYVQSTGERHDDVARLFFSSHGGAVSDPNQLNDLVAERVRVKREKLEAATDASERHLFVWLGDSYPNAELAFSTLPPPEPPPIPASVDVVWLARLAWPIRLWRVRPPGGWEIVETGRG
jgi:hypothetical protein